MTDPPRRAPASLLCGEPGLRFVEREALRDDGIVLALAGEVSRMARPAQQSLHLPRPVLVLDFDKGFEFSEQMRTTQRMEYALQ